MRFEQIHNQLRLHPKAFGYALDDTGWFLYILDRSDKTWPEPVAYDLELDEYRDSPAIPERGRKQTGWWLSDVKPEVAIGKWLAVGTPEIANMLAELKTKENIHE